jgi:hypothetical protein
VSYRWGDLNIKTWLVVVMAANPEFDGKKRFFNLPRFFDPDSFEFRRLGSDSKCHFFYLFLP